MISDSHLHSSFSADSETEPVRQAERAVSLGMRHLTFTDHYDMDFPSDELDFTFDPAEYFLTLTEYKEQFRGTLDIGIGVELGLQPHLTEGLSAFAAERPYDFIIGSTHVSRGIDPYEQERFLQDISEEAAYRRYFEEELENLTKFDCYDAAGHLDYVVRYGRTRNQNYTWDRYGDVLEAILRVLIDKGKALECNTAGWKAGLGYPHPMPEVWRRYREMGGELLTIGSDAHEPSYLGYRFTQARDFLQAMGFQYYAVYRDRKPLFFSL